MSVIADQRLALLKGLVKTLPQSALRSLELALGMTDDAAMTEVRELISTELEFRLTRDVIFAPYLPLFKPRTDGLMGTEFEMWLITNIWRELEIAEPELYAQSRYAQRGLRPEDPHPVVFIRLVHAAADICRDQPERILRAKPSQDDLAEVREFGHYLELYRVVITTLQKLPEYLGRIDAEKAAALRLLFKDACDINPESGYRFMEVLFGNLEDGAQIIKLVATVSDRPNDRFLGNSELADFGERIVDLIETRMSELRGFIGAKGKGGSDLALAGERVAQALAQIQSFGHYVELSREGPWGKRITAAQQSMAGMVETQLKFSEKTAMEALPTQIIKIGGRIKKEVPDYTTAPRPEICQQAMNVLAFVRQVKNAALAGGFASQHAKVLQSIEGHMDAYFTELLSLANGDEPFDADALAATFERVTDMMAALCGEEKAAVARRRVASSDLMKSRGKPQDETETHAA
jgi:hypothetical protein